MVMLPAALWRRLGADTEQLKAILGAKLKMDDRKPLSFGANKGIERKRKKKKKRKTKYTGALTMLLSFFMGMIYVFPIVMVKANPVIGLALFYSVFLFFFTFMLITDFVNVLVDTKDKQVLFPRPINDRTITLSRLLYIAIYLFRVALPMSIPAWILFGIFKGWVGVLWFPFPIILLLFITLFLVCGFYMLILRLSKPGKFQDVMNYVQIIFSIVFFATYMLSSRILNFEALEQVDIQVYSWAKYVPTYWLAAAWTWVEPNVEVLAGTKWLSSLAIIFPVLSLWLTVKYLAPSFVKSLVSSDDVGTEKKKETKKVKRDERMHRWANMLNKSDIGKAGFIMTWIQTGRSKTFRMRVLPTIAYVPVYFIYILMGGFSGFQNGRSFGEVWRRLPETDDYLILLYMTTFVLMQGLGYVTMSESYKASWVYYSAPINKPGQVIVGAFKALWVKYYLPFMVIVSLFTISTWGYHTIIDVILATVNTTLFTVAVSYKSYRSLPFSMKEQMKERGVKTVFRVLGVFLLIIVMAGLHYIFNGASSLQRFLERIGYDFIDISWLTGFFFIIKLIYLALSSALLYTFYNSLQNTTWSSLKTNED